MQGEEVLKLDRWATEMRVSHIYVYIGIYTHITYTHTYMHIYTHINIYLLCQYLYIQYLCCIYIYMWYICIHGIDIHV